MKKIGIANICLAVAALLAFVWLITAIVLYLNFTKQANAAHGEPYEQLTTFSSYEDFDKFVTESGIASSFNTENDGEFIYGIAKTVWAEEKYRVTSGGMNGRILDEDEVAAQGDGEGLSLIVAVALTYSQTEECYTAVAYAGWSGDETTKSSLTSEIRGLDYLGLTWGGDGNIMTDERSFVGTYAEGNAIETARSFTDSYSGIVWMFNESSADGYMTSSAMKIKLEREAETTGNKADLKLTYVHSFNDSITPPKIADTNNPRTAPSLVTESLSSWQIELDILQGLEY